ncbi:metal ABC transporter solute-binding protein, Zn/Mn family [Actinokineospora sp. 24-640]
MTSRRFRPAPVVAGLAATVLFGVAACGESPAEPQGPAAAGTTVVVTSTNVWASVVRAVGGDKVTVRAILEDPAADPHGYEAKPADAVVFEGARLAVSNGGGYDDFFTGLADSAGPDLRRVVAVDLAGAHAAEESHPEESHSEPPSETRSGEEPAEDGHGHEHAENEHVWYDLETVHAVAEKVAADLAAIDPANAAAFTANAEGFGTELDALAGKAAAIGAAKPGAKVVATEPVAEHLLEAAGLTDVTPAAFAEAVEEETDPPAAARAETEALVTGGQIAALVYNEQTSTPVTEAVKAAAEGAGVPVVGMTETLPEGVTSYLEWMTKQVDDLAAAVKP